MEKTQKNAIPFAVLAAALYALNSPVSKILLSHIPTAMMAGLLYLGAGIGLLSVKLVQKRLGKVTKESPLTRKELPCTVAMVLLDIAAPVCLMLGLANGSASNASLLNNFEIAATSLIALLLFKENIEKRLWLSIFLVTLASIILSFEDMSSFSFSLGSLFVLLACIFWGFENNCTRKLSFKDPMEIVIIKGFGSGLGSLFISLAIGERFFSIPYILLALLLGFIAYGLSIFFYIHAQRNLGAAKTSAYYAVSPFIGVFLSLFFFREIPALSFWAALGIMLLGTWLANSGPTKSKISVLND